MINFRSECICNVHTYKYINLSLLNDYVKSKSGKNAKHFYMDTDSFNVHVKTDDACKNIAEDVEKRFDTSDFALERPLPKEKKR